MAALSPKHAAAVAAEQQRTELLAVDSPGVSSNGPTGGGEAVVPSWEEMEALIRSRSGSQDISLETSSAQPIGGKGTAAAMPDDGEDAAPTAG